MRKSPPFWPLDCLWKADIFISLFLNHSAWQCVQLFGYSFIWSFNKHLHGLFYTPGNPLDTAPNTKKECSYTFNIQCNSAVSFSNVTFPSTFKTSKRQGHFPPIQKVVNIHLLLDGTHTNERLLHFLRSGMFKIIISVTVPEKTTSNRIIWHIHFNSVFIFGFIHLTDSSCIHKVPYTQHTVVCW